MPHRTWGRGTAPGRRLGEGHRTWGRGTAPGSAEASSAHLGEVYQSQHALWSSGVHRRQGDAVPKSAAARAERTRESQPTNGSCLGSRMPSCRQLMHAQSYAGSLSIAHLPSILTHRPGVTVWHALLMMASSREWVSLMCWARALGRSDAR